MTRGARRTLLLVLLAVAPAAAAAQPAVSQVRSGGKVLATGDSMIQIIDSFLERRLERRRGVRVVSDARISTGLSKAFLLN